MKIFLAGTGGLPFLEEKFYDFNRLASYEYLKKDAREKLVLNNYNDFILDSGIFSFLNGKNAKNVDWEKYMFEYAEFVKKYEIKNYVEIDIDKMVGLAEVEKLREKLNKKVGWKCIPVWHMNRGYDKWLEICRDYDYVCFGAFLTDGLEKSKFHMIQQFLEDAKKENCKVHGLGFTNFEWLKKLKFYSVDSSSWTVGNRFGSICQFQRDRIKAITRPEGTKIKDHHKLGWHNFNEWVKFSKWAEKNIIRWFVTVPLIKKLQEVILNESFFKCFNFVCGGRYVKQYFQPKNNQYSMYFNGCWHAVISFNLYFKGFNT